MNITQSIAPQQRVQQTMRPTASLIQRMSVVQRPLHSLKAAIYAEAASNPALEVTDQFGSETVYTIENEYTFDDSHSSGFQGDENANRMFLEGAISGGHGLHDHLWAQLQLESLSRSDLEVGYLLINNLDDRGFHIVPPQEVVPQSSANRIDVVAEIIQQLDPVGTCVSDFTESLLVQARVADTCSNIVVTIIKHHLEDVQSNHLDRIAERIGVDRAQVQHGISILRTLDPFPGLRFSPARTEAIKPELILRRRNGEFFISYNDEEMPVLQVDEMFLSSLHDRDAETRRFVKDHVTRAQQFINDVKWRNHKMLRVGRAILEFQRDYFLKGKQYLAPLTLSDIAQALDLSDATISRLTKGKYMQTEWGVFELKYFFSNEVCSNGADGKRYSKEGVKEMVREIVESFQNQGRKAHQTTRSRRCSICGESIYQGGRSTSIEANWDSRR
jgi:RNA polymerase sigma-54 factor